mmetsp:Transcript_92525/g.214998  ORF Transcript_92525/g.214998 Transcript_92525/m.214998 type:complete len:272 (+) Transcript_92525:389-1204(+)
MATTSQMFIGLLKKSSIVWVPSASATAARKQNSTVKMAVKNTSKVNHSNASAGEYSSSVEDTRGSANKVRTETRIIMPMKTDQRLAAGELFGSSRNKCKRARQLTCALSDGAFSTALSSTDGSLLSGLRWPHPALRHPSRGGSAFALSPSSEKLRRSMNEERSFCTGALGVADGDGVTVSTSPFEPCPAMSLRDIGAAMFGITLGQSMSQTSRRSTACPSPPRKQSAHQSSSCASAEETPQLATSISGCNKSETLSSCRPSRLRIPSNTHQ